MRKRHFKLRTIDRREVARLRVGLMRYSGVIWGTLYGGVRWGTLGYAGVLWGTLGYLPHDLLVSGHRPDLETPAVAPRRREELPLAADQRASASCKAVQPCRRGHLSICNMQPSRCTMQYATMQHATCNMDYVVKTHSDWRLDAVHGRSDPKTDRRLSAGEHVGARGMRHAPHRAAELIRADRPLHSLRRVVIALHKHGKSETKYAVGSPTQPNIRRLGTRYPGRRGSRGVA
jgi:hypothetical protein